MATKKYERIPCNLIMNDLRQVNAEKFEQELREKMKNRKNAKTYTEYNLVQTDNGLEQVLVEVAYPITADYVKSFEQSTDYRLDVDNAIANGKGGQNLGNVTVMQELYKMDTEQLKQVVSKISTLQNRMAKVKADSVKKVEKEVKDNG